jgi:hypothetical protein
MPPEVPLDDRIQAVLVRDQPVPFTGSDWNRLRQEETDQAVVPRRQQRIHFDALIRRREDRISQLHRSIVHD